MGFENSHVICDLELTKNVPLIWMKHMNLNLIARSCTNHHGACLDIRAVTVWSGRRVRVVFVRALADGETAALSATNTQPKMSRLIAELANLCHRQVYGKVA